MAEPQSATKQALKKLEDQLTCAICLEPYKDPKLLQCFHVFCEQCLVRLVVQDRQGQLSVRCPNCRQSTLLPAASVVSGLQPAFHIHHLFEEKEPQAANTDHVSGDVGKSVPPKKVTLYCRFHKERELELYCETCEELICLQCALRLHSGHKYDLVSEIFVKHKIEITASLEPVEKQLATVNEALEQLDTRHEQITDQRATIEADIHKSIQRLHEELDVRRTELIGQLNHMTQLKMKNLATQRGELEMIQTQLNSCLEFVRESLRTGSQGEVMNMKSPVVTQIKKMTADFKPDTLKTTELADMRFTSSSLPVEQFGKVYLQQASPEKCYVSTKGMHSALVDKKTTAILHVVDGHGEACVVPVESVNCELVSEITAKKTKCTTKQVDNGRYEISYQPTTRGRHQLHIKVEGGHIKGSPFPVVVKLQVEKLRTPTKIIYGPKRPWGVAVNHRGEVIVAENLVSIFTPSGKKIRTFGSRGSGQGQFIEPSGVAVDSEDNILVVDGGSCRIQKFTRDGQFLKAVGTKGSGCLQFSHPVGVAIHPHNKKVYVADRSNHRIQILNADLSFFSTFGGEAGAYGQFVYPWDVAFDSAGDTYVADSENNCIHVFTAEGTFLRKIGRKGRGDGELDHPSSVAVDSDNVVYVTERDNHRISVFSSEGTFLTSQVSPEKCTKGDVASHKERSSEHREVEPRPLTSSDEVFEVFRGCWRNMRRVVSQYYKFSEKNSHIPFIDPVTVVVCDHRGIEHTLVNHGITLKIPEGAIPKGQVIHMELAVALYGPFSFPNNTRPISPILWLCPQEDIEFNKPIQVTLPHFLTGLSQVELAQLGVQFVKANHNNPSVNFQPFSSWTTFTRTEKQDFGTLETTHCCLICITAGQCPELARKEGHCFSRIDCKGTSSTNVVYFFVTFNLPSCLQTLNNLFSHEQRKDMRHTLFKFEGTGDGSEPHLKIVIQDHPLNQYFVDVHPFDRQIMMSDVDFWAKGYTEEKMKHNQNLGFYPPRVRVIWIPKNGDGVRCSISVVVNGCVGHTTLNSNVILPLAAANGNNDVKNSEPKDVLTERDHFKICQYLHPMLNIDIIHLGQVLGLLRSNLKKMNTLPDEMVDAWLIKADHVLETSGWPTWMSLYEALKKTSHPGIAVKIKRQEIDPDRVYL